MGKKNGKTTLKVNGEGFDQLSQNNMKTIQASGAMESSNMSEHVFAARILKKGGGINGK